MNFMVFFLTKELSMARRKKYNTSTATEPFQAFSVQALPPLLPTLTQSQAYVA